MTLEEVKAAVTERMEQRTKTADKYAEMYGTDALREYHKHNAVVHELEWVLDLLNQLEV